MKKTTLLIIYNILAIFIIFFILEFLTRRFFPQIKPQGSDKNLFIDNVYFDSHGLKPLSSGYSNGALVKINQYGFREFNTKVDTSKKSWLILGDSVTMGIGVKADSTFTGRLQSQLNSVNILNPSVVGYAIKDYKNLCNHFITKQKNKLHISRIIIFWCLNDIYLDVPDFQTPGGSLRYLLGDVLKIIRTRSRFYMLLKTLLFDRPKSYYMFDEKFYYPDSPELKNTINDIFEINNLCDEQNVNFSIVLLPYEYQMRDSNNLIDTPQKLMCENLTGKGITVLNPMYVLAESQFDSKTIFLFGDGIHLSNLGHRLIAEFMNSSLKSK